MTIEIMINGGTILIYKSGPQGEHCTKPQLHCFSSHQSYKEKWNYKIAIDDDFLQIIRRKFQNTYINQKVLKVHRGNVLEKLIFLQGLFCKSNEHAKYI